MSTLFTVLDSIGYSVRPQQEQLYHELLQADTLGVVVQAGTGTGKSLGVLCAAVDWYQKTRKPSLVVCPTNVLLDQYLTVDAPRVQAAIPGLRIESLKGRNRYLCESANGFSDIARPLQWVVDELSTMSEALHGSAIFEPQNTTWFGCPGGDECDADKTCHYRAQKEAAQNAHVIVTNSHLLIIDAQMKRMQAAELAEAALDPDAEPLDDDAPPLIFPPLGVVLVDETHMLEDSLREFASRSISSESVEGHLLGYWIDQKAAQLREPTAVMPDSDLVVALQEMADQQIRKGDPKRFKEAVEASTYMLQRGQAGAYSSSAAVMFVTPRDRYVQRSQNKVTTTQIDMSLAARGLLTAQPFGLVSATVPRSLRDALGIPEARFVDVGHPFDYRSQAKLGISRYTGQWKAVQADPTNVPMRAAEIQQQVETVGGGALLLFPSYKDLDTVHRLIAGPLHLAGFKVLKQERESNKALLGAQFKADGNAVLFGTESFATGFDVPGDALRLVAVWKLPYPGLDPITKAISSRNYQRYTDMMLTKVAQAAGRLIRTSEDRGEVWIADQRARGLILNTGDPMLAHFDQFQLVTAAPQTDRMELD